MNYNGTGPAMRDLSISVVRFTTWLIIFSVILGLLLLVLLLIWYAVIKNKKRQYEFVHLDNADGQRTTSVYGNEKDLQSSDADDESRDSRMSMELADLSDNATQRERSQDKRYKANESSKTK